MPFGAGRRAQVLGLQGGGGEEDKERKGHVVSSDKMREKMEGRRLCSWGGGRGGREAGEHGEGA